MTMRRWRWWVAQLGLASLALARAAIADSVASCTNQPNFACATGADTITGSWLWATGFDVTFSNLGIQFAESDTNPSCGAGDFKIYADASEAKLKRCENAIVSDLGGGAAAGSNYTLAVIILGHFGGL